MPETRVKVIVAPAIPVPLLIVIRPEALKAAVAVKLNAVLVLLKSREVGTKAYPVRLGVTR